MRIDGTNRLGPQELPEGSASASKASRNGQAQQAAAAELCRSQAQYVSKALAADDIDLKAVAEARELIRTGQLDAPDAVRRAAQAILRQDS